MYALHCIYRENNSSAHFDEFLHFVTAFWKTLILGCGVIDHDKRRILLREACNGLSLGSVCHGFVDRLGVGSNVARNCPVNLKGVHVQ